MIPSRKEINFLRILLSGLFAAYFCLIQAEVAYSQDRIIPPPLLDTPLAQELPQPSVDLPGPYTPIMTPPPPVLGPKPPVPTPKPTPKP